MFRPTEVLQVDVFRVYRITSTDEESLVMRMEDEVRTRLLDQRIPRTIRRIPIDRQSDAPIV